MLLTPKIEKAIRRASQLHDGQKRKVEHNLPYISHLFSVATILSTHAEDEDLLIAGLLHDSLEDTPYTPEELEFEFGATVRKTVEQVTETPFSLKDKILWKDKKLAYLEKLKQADARALMVAAADKIHNLQTTIDDYKKRGADPLKGFWKDIKERMWLYEQSLAILEDRLESPIVPAYRKVFDEAISLFSRLL